MADYDVVVVDCSPTAGALRHLTLTDTACTKIRKLANLERKVLRLIRPVVHQFGDMRELMPSNDAYLAFDDILGYVGRLGAMLKDPTVSSIRLVLNPDRIALAETTRAFTYFGGAAAFGFALAYLGRGWRSTLFWLAWASLVFALGASLVLAIVPDRDLLLPVFSVLVLVGVTLVIATALHPDLRARTRRDGLIVGFLLSVIFFVLENLRTLGLVAVPIDVEWIKPLKGIKSTKPWAVIITFISAVNPRLPHTLLKIAGNIGTKGKKTYET